MSAEARLRLAQEAAGVGVWEITLDDGQLHHSPESAALFGLAFSPTPLDLNALAPVLGTQLGQTLVVENRGGSAGLLGMEQAARAAPDHSAPRGRRGARRARRADGGRSGRSRLPI